MAPEVRPKFPTAQPLREGGEKLHRGSLPVVRDASVYNDTRQPHWLRGPTGPGLRRNTNAALLLAGRSSLATRRAMDHPPDGGFLSHSRGVAGLAAEGQGTG